jgi:hypothetical protein
MEVNIHFELYSLHQNNTQTQDLINENSPNKIPILKAKIINFIKYKRRVYLRLP